MILQKVKMISLFFLLVLNFSACSTLSGPDKLLLDIPDDTNANLALKSVMEHYIEVRSRGRDTAPMRAQIERLADKYPYSVNVLQTNAEIAFEYDERQKAGRFLDRLYQVDPTLPNAAVLRSRLALRDGNRVLARTILNRQLKLTPDHYGLYESLAGVQYFEKKYLDAKESLEKAYKLGAPRNRINYHLGLISEELGKPEKAIKHYEEALKGDEPFDDAHPRLIALQALRSLNR